jgi:hypothetical protein
MVEFAPDLTTRLPMHTYIYEFLPHPVLPGEVSRMVREQATTYQLRRLPDQTLWAMKVSNPTVRNPQICQQTESVRQFQHLPGLRSASRFCLTRALLPELISRYPALEFAVMMPWIQGLTWAGFFSDAITSATYTRQQALELALSMAHILWSLERHRLTHTDIAGDNVIVVNPQRVELIDLEGLYRHGTPLPARPGRGWRGYQHRRLDARGNCRPEGDRYAGAMLLTEMLTWWKPLVRAVTEGDSLFEQSSQEAPDALNRRLTAVRATLREISPGLQPLFDRAWEAPDLADCPDFSLWVIALLQARAGC